jgi:hypothetical protein
MFSINKSKATDVVNGIMVSGGSAGGEAKAGGVFTVQCHDAQGNLKWETNAPNLVMNVGLQDMNTKYFTGSSYTATWYLGLYGAAASNNPAASDTMSSHSGWTEQTGYSQTTRPACTFGAATTADPSVITNTLAPASFSMNATATIGGAFLTSDNTKSGTTGILFSAADFASPGDRSVVSGDTLSVTYTFSLDAA